MYVNQLNPFKMKTTKLKIGLLGLIAVPFLMGCPKSPKNMAPQLDEELQSSVDAAFASFAITDIDMACSFMLDNIDNNIVFYSTIPVEDASKLLINRAPGDNQATVTYYNNAKCLDGKARNGTIFMTNTNSNPNAYYYRNYEFVAKIVLNDYRIDEWLIRNLNDKPCYIYNQLSSSTYDPAKTNLSWLIDGSFEFINAKDPSKNMVWTGKLTKTLVNTSDKNVFNPSNQQAINWSKAIVSYAGEATGFTSVDLPFKISVNTITPLIRDFSCYPSVVGGIETVQPLKTWTEEFHPFTGGIATFTTEEKYPRQIYFGNEGDSQSANQCDNSGIIMIKGVSYAVDFKK
jgi:hypothetical protein